MVITKIASQRERALARVLRHKEGDKRFQNHRKTYITEADITEIGIFPSVRHYYIQRKLKLYLTASYGINTLRVAVGYWVIGYDNIGPSKHQA